MKVDIAVPQIGESITTVFISRWLAQPGEYVAEGAALLEVDSDKATLEVPAPQGGVLLEQLAEEGEEIAIGAVVARIDTEGSPSAVASVDAVKVIASDVRAGPAARQAAGQVGLPLREVQGSAKHGRVTRADVESAKTAVKPAKAPTVDPVVASRVGAGQVERVPMSPLRRTVARVLVQAQNEAAMLTTFNEIDMSAVKAARVKYQERFVKKYGIKLGFMSFFVKAAIDSLKAHPAVNAEISGTDILYKNFYNIAIAVSGPKGLVVPVLRDADQLSFSQTEAGISELAVRARENRLRLDDFKDGTFTISNGGVFGSMMSTPILNRPQVGILGMHAIIDRPVAVNGQVEIRPMMYVALSYDHRIIDGREAVGFLKRIKECIENPERMLFEV